jgi:hypothetical protein
MKFIKEHRMPTANITPTYYRVTWTGTSVSAGPNYNALTGNQAGGLDNCAPEKYLRLVRAVGSFATPSVANADTIQINGVTIQFTSGGGTDLAGIISTINMAQSQTQVLALESPSTYLTLINTSGNEGYPITLVDVTGGVVEAKLGLLETTYETGLFQQGGALTLPLTNLDNVKINGITITFVTGALNEVGVVATINASTMLTGVSARSAGVGIALISENGQPFTLAAGSTAGTWGNLGFTVGNKGGSIVAGVDNQTPTQSLDKERATMRWDAVVFELGWLISPIFLGQIYKTGNLNGTAPVSTLAFTVGYDRPAYLSTEDELTPGVQLTGTACVKRLIARALTQTYVGNQEIFDPTLTSVGNTCVRVNPLQIVSVTAQALDAPGDIVTMEGNITVTQIANV